MTHEPQRRAVHGVLRKDATPVTTEIPIQETLTTTLVVCMCKIASDFRCELGLFAIIVGICAPIANWSFPLALLGVVVVSGTLFLVPTTRRPIARQLSNARLRRCFDRAARFAGLATLNDHVPTPKKITWIPAGSQLLVHIPSGSTFSMIEAARESLATCLDAREVRVEPDKANSRYATLTIIDRDPFEGSCLPWPGLSKEHFSLWKPIPVGVDEFGNTVEVSLPERNVLIGGEPGAGKSVALSQLVAAAALDPTAQLSIFDGKRVELACWSKRANNNVGPSIDDAIDVLAALRAEMDHRYELLLDAHKRKVEPDMGIPLHVVVCDELAFYLTMGERKATTEFANLMRDLVARGRAAGVIILGATQKPSHDIIPTSLRDLFAFRWALRCTTPQASDTVLGQGWSSLGFNAKDIDSSQRGVGYLLSEGQEPKRIKSFYLSDDELEALAKRAGAIGRSHKRLKVA